MSRRKHRRHRGSVLLTKTEAISQLFPELLIIPLGYKLGIKKKKLVYVNAIPSLEEVYKTKKKPDDKQCMGLSKQLDMPLRQVQVWFRNKRNNDLTPPIKKFCDNASHGYGEQKTAGPTGQSRLIYSTAIEIFHFIDEPFFVYYFVNVFLLILQVLSLLWSWSIGKIIYNTLFAGGAEDIRSDTEEGDSLSSNGDLTQNGTTNGVDGSVTSADTIGHVNGANATSKVSNNGVIS
ncbi:CERS5-like protein [Mya arenaria]|uniref:CERS5-like protein n=1 Tax=Mya arenaria TaxID=6604 RepID=A0ABY7DCH8_MYAAR|nr:CERS5-like protein [Mya arenaria]